ncbi:hypothetical protein P280DRAFT_505673 [Massarina eburnea CBS 473.64]|uniref:Rhodopsin domain-containing protein n=1 Tax=Massarina eburnea CBS 473.64 TaxID=1395130 RepID=A0A6A6S7E6_9PLEO|nr:hypothetical protein P280DRAFT_505673 [Massarina eburnea CBS 473.64]
MDGPQEAFRHVVLRGLRLRQSGVVGAMPHFPPGYLEESRTTQILLGNILCQTVGTLFVLARAYSRIFLIGSWKSEDWVLVIGWLFATAYSICQYGQVAHGAGRHLAATTDMNVAITSQKYAFAAQLFLFEAIALPKLSICLSYLRIFYSDRIGRRLIQVLMGFLVMAMVPFFIESLFQCKPMHLYWTELRPAGKCLSDLSALYVSGSLNVAVDIALMSILIPRIMDLKLNSRQKGALIGIVALGSLAVVAGIVRMVRVGITLGKYTTGSFDPTWDSYDVSIWTSTEIYVSIICAAAPGVKPLISRVLPHVLGTTLHSRSHATGGNTTNQIELSSKFKRSTLTGTSTTGLSSVRGHYSEFGRGIDEESIGNNSEERQVQNVANGIIKKSEVTIHRSDRQEEK